MQVRPNHPAPDVLSAFGQGKLDETTAESVLTHVDACQDCRQVVLNNSGESFLNRFRQARGKGATPFPATKNASALGAPKPLEAATTAPFADPSIPPELRDHPQYQVIRELGRGGMGVVYLATNRLMDRPEVLKVMNKALLDRDGATERFLREIRSAAKLSHPNIATAHSAFQVGDLFVFAMEYIDGEDLAQTVKKNGILPVAHACHYIQQAAMGLQHAFEKGMVHRDIKPQNLILSRGEKRHVVKVLDFGLAKVIREEGEDTGLTGSGRMLGTPDYVAPEQIIDAATADIRADIYSLGCTLYYLLSGRAPFKEKSLFDVLQAHQVKNAESLTQVRPEVPAELAAVVQKMMAKDPGQRFQKPIEVAQALTQFAKPGKATKDSSKDVKSGPGSGVRPVVLEEKQKASAAKVSVEMATEQETMLEGSITSAGPLKKKERNSSRLPPKPAASGSRWMLTTVIVTALFLIGFVGLWAGGVIKIQSKDGMAVLEPSAKNETKEKQTKGTDGETKTRPEPKTGTESATVGKSSEPSTSKTNTDGFKPLFNGKDTEGWKTHPSQPGTWRVVNGILIGSEGVLVGTGLNVSHLYTERDDYMDFHLRLEARVNKQGKTGVYFRAPSRPTHPASNPKWVDGYNAKLDGSRFGGLLIGFGSSLIRAKTPSASLDDWVTMDVIVQDNHIVIKIDGETTAEYTDENRSYTSGHIVLQLHSPQPVEFRKVEIKEFPSANPGAEVGKSLPESAPDKIDKPSLKVESSVIVKVQTAGYDDASLDSTSTIVPKNSKGTVIKISRDKKFCLVRLTITREPEVWILFDKLEVE